MSKTKRRSITVGKTKVTRAPWEEERHIYDISERSGSIWSSDFYTFIIQVIVGISVFIYFMNLY